MALRAVIVQASPVVILALYSAWPRARRNVACEKMFG